MQLTCVQFEPAVPPQALAGDQVHLWFFPHWTQRRDAAESEPVRALLGTYLGRSADEIGIERDNQGKPAVRGSNLQFNLAHSGDALLLGLAWTQALGVDLEYPRKPRPVLDLARRYFDPAEAAALAALPDSLQQGAFLRLWSCKEAALKAGGQGIAGGLASVVFSVEGTGSAANLHLAVEPGVVPWQVRLVFPSPDHVGAVAWMGEEKEVRAFKVKL